MVQKHKGRAMPVQLGSKTETRAPVIELWQSTGGETVEIRIYDEIRADEYDWWTGEVIESTTSAKWIGDRLAEAPDATRINLYVNSVGGSVHEAMGIRAELLRHPATKTGYVDGWAASAASFILTACDTVHMLTGSMQFLHDMWTVVIGNARELRQAADELDRMMTGNRQMYLERAGEALAEDRLIELMEAETWLTAEECVELGLADDVMAADDYKRLIGASQRARAEPEQWAEPEPENPEEIDTPEPESSDAPSMAALFMSGFLRQEKE